ncbi:class I SAM-dependent methyltransferase [Nocardioides zeicaulis]|uniref:Class I SAM-dependent methyltransferase n=1 Tax=Nocardioides zeicaulis TaxID=1776857 RepID=A0ABV6DZ06_9ACTN
MSLRTFTRTFAGGRVARGMARVNARHPWSHNDHFHPWVLAHLPERRGTALDVGCGRGGLLAALAPRFASVVGVDTDPAMRAAARARCAGLPRVRVDDRDWTEVEGPLDLVTMVAVLHHLDVDAALQHVRDVLAPGGRLLVVGLAPPASVRDHVWDAASIVTNPLIGLAKHPRVDRSGPQPPSFPVREPTMTYDDLARRVATVLPGATMRHRLAFRHTIAWTKPGPAARNIS